VRGNIAQPLVEVLPLHAGVLPLAHESGDVRGDLGGFLLEIADPFRVEATAVPGHLAFDLLEPAGYVDEAPARRYEPLDERAHDLKRVVRLFLGEELHRAMLNSAVA
jgi:hypothetical protein